MTILSSDLKYYKSLAVLDGPTNGGRFSTNEAVSGIPNSVWPDVLKPERDAGSTLYRKLFFKVNSINADIFAGVDLWNEIPTPADDWMIMFAGTPTDTEATLSETTFFGAGVLKNAVVATGTSIIVTVEDDTIVGMFQDGDKIRITNKSTPTSGIGTEDITTINGAPSVSGSDVTIALDDALANDYDAGIRVHSILEHGDVQATTDSVVVTSSAGTFDDTTYPIAGVNAGAQDEEITLTLAEAGLASAGLNFTVVGSVSGALATGNTASDYTPDDGTNDMFTVLAAGWGGTYAINDTVVFNTNSATVPFWLKRVIPAASSYLAANSNTTIAYGQSA